MTERMLVFAPQTKRWEICHAEIANGNGLEIWVRDDQSTSCFVGKELAKHPLPSHPDKLFRLDDKFFDIFEA